MAPGIVIGALAATLVAGFLPTRPLAISFAGTAAKPGDEPVATFEAKVPSVGPEETKDVTVEVPTKLRIYELPDWQFLRGEFEILAPAP